MEASTKVNGFMIADREKEKCKSLLFKMANGCMVSFSETLHFLGKAPQDQLDQVFLIYSDC